MTAELVPAETARLAELEAVVTDGLQTFVTVGRALAEIRDSRLYRQTHDTFEAYCQQQWSLSRPRAYELINAATTTEALSAIADTPPPMNEGQARELRGLPTETAAEVMRKAHDATAGKVTAAAIRQVREDVAPKTDPDAEARYFAESDAEAGRRAAQVEAELRADRELLRPRPRVPEPVMTGDRLARYDGEKRSAHLGAACMTLAALTEPLPREQYIEAWRDYPEGASPAQRDRVGPDQFRAYADALHTLADEWEKAHA